MGFNIFDLNTIKNLESIEVNIEYFLNNISPDIALAHLSYFIGKIYQLKKILFNCEVSDKNDILNVINEVLEFWDNRDKCKAEWQKIIPKIHFLIPYFEKYNKG